MTRRQGVIVCAERQVGLVVMESRGRNYRVDSIQIASWELPLNAYSLSDENGLAETVSRAMSALPNSPETWTLVVPLTWCFTHPLRLDKRTRSQAAKAFALEEHLPVPAEDVTCEFVTIGHERVLGVAIPTEPLCRLLARLRDHGIVVEHVTADALALGLARDGDGFPVCRVIKDEHSARCWWQESPGEAPQTVVIGVRDLDDSAALASKVMARLGFASAEWVDLRFDVLDLTPASELVPESGEAGTAKGSVFALERIARAALDSVNRLDLCAEALTPPQRRGTLLRQFDKCAACLVLLALVWLIGWETERRSLRRDMTAIQDAQLAAFQQATTVKQLPPGAALRLASERKRLEATTRPGLSTTAEQGGTIGEPLDVLRQWALRVPADVRVLINDVRGDERQFSLRGQTVEHRDAERLAEALRDIPGWQGGAPHTRRIDGGGVEFSVVASFQAESGRGPNP